MFQVAKHARDKTKIFYFSTNSTTHNSLLIPVGASFTSCLDIKSTCPSCKSGFYKIEWNEKVVEYFCDMETDGGKMGFKTLINKNK